MGWMNDAPHQERAVPGENATHRARIFVVVVLYKQRPAASTTVATLGRALRENHSVDSCVQIWDNGPSGDIVPGELPEGFQYHPAPVNRGLYAAYEGARLCARTQGYDWLLTLDQDTALPVNFFSAIEPGLRAAQEDPRIGAIVPHLAEGERLLSPAYVGIGRATLLPANFAGVPAREARAFNSAALLRVNALDAIGGFDPCFWLDHLDSWLHHQLYVHGWRMYVLDSVHLEHHFSLLNYGERISPERFRNFLSAESAYVDFYGSWWARAAYTAQLGVRLMNQVRRREASEIRRATRAAWLRRLTVSRAKRILQWRQDAGGSPR
jgi:hypothetical protein